LVACVAFVCVGKCRTYTNRIAREIMKKPDRKKQQRQLARGKKKAERELLKKREAKKKRKVKLAQKITDRRAERETFKMEEEVRKLQAKYAKKNRKPVDKQD
jgi:hypothetical protein